MLKIDLDEDSENASLSLGIKAETCLKKCTPLQHINFRKDVRKFYVTVVSKLLKKLPLSKPILKYVKCLNPDMRTEKDREELVRKLAETLTNVLTREEDIDILTTEWRLYSIDTEINESRNASTAPVPIDECWTEIL